MITTGTGSRLAEAAERLSMARAKGPCAPVRELIGTDDLDAAYAVQAMTVAGWLGQGRTVVGHKIGLTAAAVQRQFGVFQPDFGTLIEGMAFSDGEEISLDQFLQPRVEAEVAFVLGRDLDAPGATVADVIRATEFVLPAIEIVDSRIAGWDITITDTVADNASSGAFVMGTTPHRLDGLDLAGIGMALERRYEPVSTGTGAACMGSPLITVAWLCRELSGRGQPLRAGSIVLSGALGPMFTVDGPEVFRARLDGLGQVQAAFTGSLPTGTRTGDQR